MLNHLKNNIGSAMVFILGIIIAMIGLTLSVSHINSFNRISQLSAKYRTQPASEWIIQANDEKRIKDVIRNMGKSEGSAYILIHDFILGIDNKSQLANILLIVGEPEEDLGIPILSGRPMSPSDFCENRPVVLLGNTKDYDVGENLTIGGSDFEVIGLTGVEEVQLPALVNAVYLSAIQLPDEVYNSLAMNGKLNISIVKPSENFDRSFQEGLKEKEIPFVQAEPPESDSINHIYYVAALTNIMYIYIISTLNMINISIFWVNKRKKEIGIRKAFGYSNSDILLLFIEEMGIIISGSVGAVLILLFLGSPVLETISNQRITFAFSNVIISVLFIIITTIISVLTPISIAARVEPADMVKG